MRMRFVSNNQARPAGLLRKLVALIVTLTVFVLALMFSAMLLVVIAVAGSIAFAYFWWKTREARKILRRMRSVATPEARRETQASNDGVYEGEVIRVVDPKDAR